MSVFRVSPKIAIQVVAHVYEFFSDHDFRRPGKRAIDPVQIDEHRMTTCMAQITVGTTIRGRNSTAQPCAVDPPVRRHPKIIRGKIKAKNIVVDK